MRFRSFLAVFLLHGPVPALAGPDLSNVEMIVVTATRTPKALGETLASTTVIKRDDIEREQARSLADTLRGVPGVSLANNGGGGKATSVFLRGAEADHVLVLIDGVKVGSATLGTASIQDIPIDQIERIEIVRGPRSGLYGSEAIGGVIQIFTRRGEGPLRPHLSLGGGSHGTSSGSAGLSGGTDRAWFNVNVSGERTNGINACRGKPSPGGAGCFVIEPDKDGYRDVAGSIRAGYRLDDRLDTDVHWLRGESRNEFDGSVVNESESVQQVLGGRVAISSIEPWRVTLAGGRSEDKSDNFKDGVFRSRFDTTRYSASLQNDIAIAEGHLFTMGFDYQKDEVDGTTAYAVTSRDNKAVFAQHQTSVGIHDLELALRWDDNQQFGTHTTGSAAYGLKLTESLKLMASYGTAFKAPTFNELYFPGFGNPNIGPETAESVEVGVSGTIASARWSLNAYQTKIDDLIAFDASLFAPNNIDEARIRGLEAVVEATIQEWQLRGSVTLLDPENRSDGANRGKVLPRRARESVRIDLDRQLARLSFGATLLYQGKRYDDIANTRKLDPYATIDLRVEFAFSKSVRLQGRIANLFDTDYETAALFNQPGRIAFVTLRFEP